MPITAADFRTRQRFEANDSTLTDAQLDFLRDDALADVSQAMPALLTSSLSILPSTTSYSLPTDFLTLSTTEVSVVDGEPLYRLTTAADVVLHEGTDFHCAGLNLVLAVAPGVSATWVLTYGGIHTVATLPTHLIPIVLDAATARFYDRKATEAAAYFQYSTGSISVDKSEEIDHWLALRDARRKAVDAALAALTTATPPFGSFRVDRA